MISNLTFYLIGIFAIISLIIIIYFILFGDYNSFVKHHPTLSFIGTLVAFCLIIALFGIQIYTIHFKMTEENHFSSLISTYNITNNIYNYKSENVAYIKNAQEYNEEAKKWIDAYNNPKYAIFFKNCKCNWDELPLITLK